ncbi:MAG: trimethylamine methyltransferase family protein [Gammaproteobacteria bacterium]|nr:trimethylamine methyltransferase family protein [Gammaproteobacteria bacterium]
MLDASDSNDKQKNRKSRRRRNRSTGSNAQTAAKPNTLGIEGGHYTPLNSTQISQIDRAVYEILEKTGFSEAPPIVIETVTKAGGKLNRDNRLTFPASLLDKALHGLARHYTLYGQVAGHEMQMSGKHVHTGSGGAAPYVVDIDSGQYRDSTLKDLYDAARLVNSLDNIHFFSRSLVARDMPDEISLDINTAYASLSGCEKHAFIAATKPEHVEKIAQMCFIVAGSRENFLEKPFVSLNNNHVVSPLKFSADACGIMAEAARLGIPVHANSFGQLGASSPVTIAGTLAQNVAETLAGMVFAWLVNPDAKVIFGCRPMLTDLRTGGMTGGSGEQAQLMAATALMAQFYDLPNSCIAGATDSKLADAQSGYEKSLSVTLAAQAGSNAITQAAGTQGSLMGCALESYIIDNDMLGSILRSLSPLQIDETTLMTRDIDTIVRNEGHFLGHPQTLHRMQSDFLYPEIADRRTFEEWQADGSNDIRQVAKKKAREILSSQFPKHIPADIDDKLRALFDIRLPQFLMEKP